MHACSSICAYTHKCTCVRACTHTHTHTHTHLQPHERPGPPGGGAPDLVAPQLLLLGRARHAARSAGRKLRNRVASAPQAWTRAAARGSRRFGLRQHVPAPPPRGGSLCSSLAQARAARAASRGAVRDAPPAPGPPACTSPGCAASAPPAPAPPRRPAPHTCGGGATPAHGHVVRWRARAGGPARASPRLAVRCMPPRGRAPRRHRVEQHCLRSRRGPSSRWRAGRAGAALACPPKKQAWLHPIRTHARASPPPRPPRLCRRDCRLVGVLRRVDVGEARPVGRAPGALARHHPPQPLGERPRGRQALGFRRGGGGARGRG